MYVLSKISSVVNNSRKEKAMQYLTQPNQCSEEQIAHMQGRMPDQIHFYLLSVAFPSQSRYLSNIAT